MIEVPTRGLARSVGEHNVDLQVLCDWIEASVVFTGDGLSKMEVADRLLEEEICDEQDSALEIVADAWLELERRATLYGEPYGITIDNDRVRTDIPWSDNPAHAFCLLLSVSTRYDWWAQKFGHDYMEQGELFELLTKESLRVLAPGWKTYLTGWTRSQPAKFGEIAKEVARRVSDGVANLELWDTGRVKDLTLDLLFYRPFPDGREGFPYFLIQCASGGNWQGKIKDPDLDVWRDIVRPATFPMRGFAVPFCYSDDEFKRNCVRVTGLFLDRCRLLGVASSDRAWLSEPIAERIVDWMKPRVERLASM